MPIELPPATRRSFLAAAAVGTVASATQIQAQEKSPSMPVPPEGKRILLSCKMGMIAKKDGDKDLSIVQRLNLAKQAGYDGVDFDEAGSFTPEQVRNAARESGVFIHNAINHAHWNQRLTSANSAERAQGVANIQHCLRVAHAAGGSGVLIVVGRGDDGPPDEIDERARQEIKKLIPPGRVTRPADSVRKRLEQNALRPRRPA